MEYKNQPFLTNYIHYLFGQAVELLAEATNKLCQLKKRSSGWWHHCFHEDSLVWHLCPGHSFELGMNEFITWVWKLENYDSQFVPESTSKHLHWPTTTVSPRLSWVVLVDYGYLIEFNCCRTNNLSAQSIWQVSIGTKLYPLQGVSNKIVRFQTRIILHTWIISPHADGWCTSTINKNLL